MHDISLPMRHRDRALLLAAGIGILALFARDSSASNGMRPVASGGKAFGRGGADLAWTGSATSMNSNPALIVLIPDEQFEVTPVILNIDARYSDARNGEVRSTGKSKFGFDFAQYPFANVAYVFDLDKTETEVLEGLRETDPYHKMRTEPRAPPQEPDKLDPILGQGKILDQNVRVSSGRFPRKIEMVARGEKAWLTNVSVVANYYTNDPARAFSHILASSGRRAELGSSSATVAVFDNLSNPLVDPPDEILVYYQLEVEFKSGADSAEVRVLLDGHDSGGRLTTRGDVEPEAELPRLEDKTPRFQHELWGAKKDGEKSNLKFGVGFFVNGGAGTEYDIKTEIYPDGVRHFSDFSFVTLAPTIGFKILDWLAVGLTLQLHYGTMNLDLPARADVEIMQGDLFPAGSLDGLLSGFFGLPSEFGPAMKYALNTSDTHDPGKSITHSNRQGPPAGQDSRFSEITGKAEVKDAISFGAGVRLGLLFPITDRFSIGVTYQTPSFMRNYKGKARVDYNAQIEKFQQNPTIGHSDEVLANLPLVGNMEAELRFTFDETWSQGIVHVFGDIDNDGDLEEVPILSPMQLPGNDPLNPGIRGSLPNSGRDGFTAEYDIELVDFQMPQEIGIGASYLVFDWLRVSVDYKRIFWSQSMKEFRARLTNGSNADINALMGSTSIEYVLPQNWEDQDVFSVGVEVYIGDWLTLRGGWNYGNNPVPPETSMPITPVITEHHVSGGVSIKWKSFTFDFAWLKALENTVTTGTSIQARDLSNSTFSVSQDFISFGFQYDY